MNNTFLFGLWIGMVVMFLFDHYVLPRLAHRWAVRRRRRHASGR